MGKRENPIAEQSRIWLIKSLLCLMDKKDYRHITISEIAENAQLSRRTFYRIFRSKEEILEDYFQMLCEEYVDCFRNEAAISYGRVTEIYFTFWEQHLKLLYTLKKNHLFFYIVEKYNEFLPKIYEICKGNQNEYENAKELIYALRFSSGGLWNVLSEWIQSTPRQSPKEMAAIISKTIEINA